jgi:hypothetical protein
MVITNKKMNIKAIARVAHEVNRAYCEALGDHSQVRWEEAPLWQRDSAVHGVVFHILNPEASPGESHENWMEEKIEEGWTYGPIKDAQKKEHPNLVPFDQLPEEQKVKDVLFKAVVDALYASRE